MKNIIALLILCLLPSSTAHAQAKTNRERDGLKGLVQTVKVRQMTLVTEDEKRTESSLVLSQAISYDRAGNRTELALYDKLGTLSRRIAYVYDAQSKKLSELTTYDAHDVITRRVVNIYGSDGLKSSQAISDFNEDGTFYRKTVLTFSPLGELVEAADYREDGSLIKKEAATSEQPSYSSTGRRSSAETEDRVIGFGYSAGEYFEPDVNGNWSRGITSSTSRTYLSGKKIKTQVVVYREFAYYQ